MSFVKDYALNCATGAYMADINFISSFGGVHNQDLENTASRLHKQGIWDNLNTVMFTPAGQVLPTYTAIAWESLHRPPNTPTARLFSLDQEVGFAYSEIIKVILEHEVLSSWKYLLTMEHDNIPPPDGLIQLLARMQDNPDLSAVSGLYFTKGKDGYAQIWGKPNEKHFCPQPPATDGSLVECRAIGMGFALFRLEMFKDERLPRPWFQTKADATGTRTHDLNFWDTATDLGYRCAVDCGCRVGHVDVANRTVW
jgi:hypothetical protein